MQLLLYGNIYLNYLELVSLFLQLAVQSLPCSYDVGLFLSISINILLYYSYYTLHYAIYFQVCPLSSRRRCVRRNFWGPISRPLPCSALVQPHQVLPESEGQVCLKPEKVEA